MLALSAGKLRGDSGRFAALACFLLFVVSSLAYANAMGNGFISFDDPNYITSNAVVQGGLSWEGLRWAFSGSHAANWHPLTWVSHMLDCSLFGLEARWHHLESVLMHAASACLLFLALRRLTGDLWPSLVVAALFGLHPLHVESVAWASERKDVLSGLFFMGTLFAYSRYVQSRSLGRYAWVALLFALGLLAKPMLVTVPFVLLLLDFWPARGLGRNNGVSLVRLFAEKLPLMILSAISVIMTLAAQSSGGSMRALSSLTLQTRIAMVPRAYVTYLLKAVWPSKLSIFYPHPAIGTGQSLHLTDSSTLLALLVLLVLTVLAIRLRNRAPYVPVGWLWFLGTLVPVIGIVQVGDQAVADRYLYLPLIGLSIPFVWGLADVAGGHKSRVRMIVGAAAASLIACFSVTWAQVRVWKDSMTLFEHSLEVTDGNYVAHTMVGLEEAKLGNDSAAEEHYSAAIEARANYVSALFLLGQSMANRGANESAQTFLERAVRFAPQRVDAKISLSAVYMALGKLEAAGQVLDVALKLEPENAQVWTNTGALAELRKDDQAALSAYRRALECDPHFDPARMNLAAQLRRMDEPEEAVKIYREILRDHPKHTPALCGLVWILSTTKDQGLRNPEEALELIGGAVQRASRGRYQLLVALAAAQAAVGQFDLAVRAQQGALAQAPREKRAEIEQHLAEFVAGRALFL